MPKTSKAVNTGTDALKGILKIFGGKEGGKVLSDAANLVTKPISTGIKSPKFYKVHYYQEKH